jgi:hypothetical protein
MLQWHVALKCDCLEAKLKIVKRLKHSVLPKCYGKFEPESIALFVLTDELNRICVASKIISYTYDSEEAKKNV